MNKKLTDLDLARAVLIDLFEQVLQLFLGGTEAHRPHDLAYKEKKVNEKQSKQIVCPENKDKKT